MRRTVFSSHPVVVSLALLLASCSGGRPFEADDGGAGGETKTGAGGTTVHATGGGGASAGTGGHAGVTGTGGGAGEGMLGSGGNGGAGGATTNGTGGAGGAATSTGGATGTGGVLGSGGNGGAGGAATNGTGGAGGAATSTGGATGTGGVKGTGGVTASGGATGTGGAPGCTSPQKLCGAVCGNCCQDSDCSGTCMTCNTTNHTCVAAKSEDDPNGRCAGTCDSTGACKDRRGQLCGTVSGGCISGTTCSVDGYCCNVACGGSGTCAGSCASGTCVFPTGNCGSGLTCSGTNIVDQSTCSNGSCVTPAAKPCDGGLVCSGNACETDCRTDADCLPSYFCEGNSCHLDAVQVSCGGGFTCVLLADGSVRCWGANSIGELGPGGPPASSTNVSPMTSVPVTVTGLGGTVQSISSNGANHSCALLSTGGVSCWGSDYEGELGNNATLANNYSATPLAVKGLPGSASSVSAGLGDFSCALMASNGALWCWGDNFAGELGNGMSGGSSPVPVQVSGLTGPSLITAGDEVMCAIVSGSAYCWGADYDGQLGDGVMSSNGVSTPGLVGLAGRVTDLAIQDSHGCAVVQGGTVECWGHNVYGEIGSTTVAMGDYALSPVGVQGLPTTATSVVTGSFHTCALLTDGTIWCWGWESFGQLGNGVIAAGGIVTPVQVTGLPAGTQVTAISAGTSQNCALLANGSVWCWGEGDNGELGNGTSNSAKPLQVAGW
jgi:alpha-tubulin suppressor-like RCC1 family protein